MKVFIPAKSTSIRTPSKNLRPFAGSSLLHVALDFYLKYFEPKDIIVSSDDSSVCDSIRDHNVVFHHRIGKLSDPHISNFNLLQLWANEVKYSGRIILSQLTHPIRIDEDIKHIRCLPSDHNFVSVRRHLLRVINSYDLSNSIDPSDLQYCVDGTYYILTLPLKDPNLTRLHPFLLSQPEIRFDIDYPHQFIAAEAVYQSFHE